jgi:hypothetical protein
VKGLLSKTAFRWTPTTDPHVCRTGCQLWFSYTSMYSSSTLLSFRRTKFDRFFARSSSSMSFASDDGVDMVLFAAIDPRRLMCSETTLRWMGQNLPNVPKSRQYPSTVVFAFFQYNRWVLNECVRGSFTSAAPPPRQHIALAFRAKNKERNGVARVPPYGLMGRPKVSGLVSASDVPPRLSVHVRHTTDCAWCAVCASPTIYATRNLPRHPLHICNQQ